MSDSFPLAVLERFVEEEDDDEEEEEEEEEVFMLRKFSELSETSDEVLIPESIVGLADFRDSCEASVSAWFGECRRLLDVSL